MTESALYRTQICNFVQGIGIDILETTLNNTTFLPGILIDAGQLRVDQAKLLYPGDLLHEAGHIAVTPPAERHLLYGNITDQQPTKAEDELAVLLWTFAACRYLAIPDEVVFHPAGYKGDSQWLLSMFNSQTYIGLPLLAWMGMTRMELFPIMTHWLRPA